MPADFVRHGHPLQLELAGPEHESIEAASVQAPVLDGEGAAAPERPPATALASEPKADVGSSDLGSLMGQGDVAGASNEGTGEVDDTERDLLGGLRVSVAPGGTKLLLPLSVEAGRTKEPGRTVPLNLSARANSPLSSAEDREPNTEIGSWAEPEGAAPPGRTARSDVEGDLLRGLPVGVTSNGTKVLLPSGFERGRAEQEAERTVPLPVNGDDAGDQTSAGASDGSAARGAFSTKAISPHRLVEARSGAPAEDVAEGNRGSSELATRRMPVEALMQRRRPAPVERPTVGLAIQRSLQRAWAAASWRMRAVYLLAPLVIALLVVGQARQGGDHLASSEQGPQPPSTTAPGVAAQLEAPPSAPSVSNAVATGSHAVVGNQRAAVDLLASGDWARAAERYEELARSNPETPVFLEAARIVREMRDEQPR